MKNINMTEYFTPDKTGSIRGSVPANAWKFGLIIQDRNLRGKFYGLNKNAIPFQYLDDGQIPILSKGANWEDNPIPGRFEPIKNYSHSNSNDMTISLNYVAEGTERNAFSKTFWTIEQIERVSSKIESLVYPQYDGAYSQPNYCLLNIGGVFIDFPIIIKNVSIQHKSPYSVRDVKPYRRDITIECSSYFPSYQAISAKDIIDTSLGESFISGGKNFPRRIYSFRRYQRRQP